ncbi:MAG: DinB family protein [Terriglobales bacterium]
MKKLLFLALAVALFAGLAPTSTLAQSTASAAPADKTPPSYDLKPQALLDLEQLHQKFVALAKEIPADKYTWRPGDGVRSVSELFLHVSSASYGLAPFFGAEKETGVDTKTLEKSTTDKDQVIQRLNQSFDYVHGALEKKSNDDLKKPVKEFGPDASAGDIVYLIIVDAHEHLGQAITYARLNGIVPPWTAEAEKKKAAEKK